MVPQRIVSLLASSTEILYGLGLGDRVVAVSHECDYPAEATSKPRVTRTRINDKQSSGEIDEEVRRMFSTGAALYEIDTAKLVELRPDLIVTQAQCDVCAVSYNDVLATVRREPALSETKVVALNPTTLEEIFTDIHRVAVAANAERAGEAYTASLRGRVEKIRAATATISAFDRPKVIGIEWIEPIMVAANWMPDLIHIAGGQCELTQAGNHSGYTPWQQLAAYDPDVIVVMPCGFDLKRSIAESPTLLQNEGWSDLSAVRAKRVFVVDGNAYFNRSGPRMIDSLEILAGLIQPNLLGNFQKKYQHAWQQL